MGGATFPNGVILLLNVFVVVRLTVLLHCTTALYYCTVLLHCTTALSYCTVLTSSVCPSTPSLSRTAEQRTHTVPHCTTALYYCTVLLHCTTALYSPPRCAPRRRPCRARRSSARTRCRPRRAACAGTCPAPGGVKAVSQSVSTGSCAGTCPTPGGINATQRDAAQG
eukprot:9212502-Pyramimonas_sp.AAC.1